MIITRTPYRVSFFGGGTDLPIWFKDHGGAVLTSTIARFCYICARPMPPFLGTKYRVFWSKMEAVNTIEEIQHPAVRAALQYTGYEEPFEVNHAGDLPARSGLGSSSAFSVGMLHALYAIQGYDVIHSKEALASAAVDLEQRVMCENVGLQDQIECAYGGLNVIRFAKSGDWRVDRLLLPDGRLEVLEASLMLFYTGLQRTSSAVQLVSTNERDDSLHAIQLLVDKAVEILCTSSQHLDDFGELLHAGWNLKRSLSANMSTIRIDSLYELARAAGAIGGKILGAGGGGFLLLYCPPERQPNVREVLSGLIEVPFRFEDRGTQLLVCDRG
jgi:D-glycero-alpha-D-manno-heptose-7-phosphate kinase